MGWLARLFSREGVAKQDRTTAGAKALPKPPPARPPADWTDEPAWDAYHAATQVRERHTPTDLGLQYVASFREKAFRRVWFPGAGTCAAPRAFAELGFHVVSSDFSAVAVAAQERFASEALDADRAAFGAVAADSPTVMRVIKHDFRKALDLPPFDVVLNRRAYQGLPAKDRKAVARVHHDAVRAGGWAMFETMNVSADRRDALEDALLEAGFVLPLNETHRWYRAALASTGITFVVILGRARVPGQNPSKRDQAKLDALTKEFEERAKLEAERSSELLASPEARIAHMIYSTG